MARIVAVPKAQSVSDFSLLEKTSTVATPIDPDIFSVLARAISSVPSAGLRKLTLISTVTPILPLGQGRSDSDPGGVIGQGRDDAAVKMTEELQEVVAASQSDFGVPRLDGHDAEARRTHEALGVDRLSELRRVEVAARHPGMRTGNCSMPRTKLE